MISTLLYSSLRRVNIQSAVWIKRKAQQHVTQCRLFSTAPMKHSLNYSLAEIHILSLLYRSEKVCSGIRTCIIVFLWSPYVMGQTIYIFILLFVLSSFFPCLISAVRDWMSAILPHMVWPLCEFRMQV